MEAQACTSILASCLLLLDYLTHFERDLLGAWTVAQSEYDQHLAQQFVILRGSTQIS